MATNDSFDIDWGPLRQALRNAPDVVGRGAIRALDAIKDDWVMEARDIAPIDPIQGGNLRRQIKGKVEKSGLDSSIMVTGNAVNRSSGSGRFNYGYYIHELNAGGDQLQTPGTEKKFLEKSVDERRWERYLVNKVLTKLRRLGWNG